MSRCVLRFQSIPNHSALTETKSVSVRVFEVIRQQTDWPVDGPSARLFQLGAKETPSDRAPCAHPCQRGEQRPLAEYDGGSLPGGFARIRGGGRRRALWWRGWDHIHSGLHSARWELLSLLALVPLRNGSEDGKPLTACKLPKHQLQF